MLIVLFVFIMNCNIIKAQTEMLRWDGDVAGSNSCNITQSSITTGGGVSALISTGVGDAQGQFYLATNWLNGSGTKYWTVNFPTTSWSSILVSSKQSSSSLGFANWDGPSEFKLQYSLDNTNWTDVINIPTLGYNWTSGVISNVALPAACNNKPVVYLRWIMRSNNSVASGGTFGNEAQSYIDDIIIKGTQTPSAPTDISLNHNTGSIAAGQLIGTLSATDANCGDTFTYSLVAGSGSTDNANFTITNNQLFTGAGLTEGTKSIRVRVNDGATTFDKVFSIILTQYPAVTISDPGDNKYNWISNVTLNTINNNSGQSGVNNADGYTNYSASISTSLSAGQTYTMSVTIQGDPHFYPGEYIHAYFDWNNDFDFSDANEKQTILTSNTDDAVSVLTSSADITVPAGLASGSIRLRVTTDYNGAGAGLVDYGEAEDYTINIAAFPTLSTNAANTIGSVSASSGGNTIVDNGNAVTSKGVVWSLTTAPALTANEAGHTSDGTANTDFTSALSPLTPNTLYYIKAYAANSSGTGYGDEKSFRTLAAVPAQSVLSNATSSSIDINPAIGTNPASTEMAILETVSNLYLQNDGTLAAGQIWKTDAAWGTKTVVNLSPNTLYGFKVKARNASSVETLFSSETQLTTLIAAPTVTTTSISNITKSSASSGGNITGLGGENASQRGICYKTSSGPTTADSKVFENGSHAAGAFTANLSGLDAGQQYFVRAYAINSSGTSYGAEVSFSTLPEPATNILISAANATDFNISWQRGNGTNCAVFIKQTQTGEPLPIDNTSYTANASYSAGSQIGTSGWYCVYKGAGTSVTVTNTNTILLHRAMVVEFTGTSGNEKYQLETSITNPKNSGADVIYVSDSYSAATSGWGYDRFNNISTGLANSTPASTVHIDAYTHTGDVDISGHTCIIDNGDFILNGNLTGGTIQAVSTGRLSLMPIQNQIKTYPISDGTNNFTVTVNCANTITNPIKIKLNTNKSIDGSVTTPMTYWDISGDSSLDATISFRIDKAVISPITLKTSNTFRFFNGSRYVPYPSDKITVSDLGTYYLITLVNVNSF